MTIGKELTEKMAGVANTLIDHMVEDCGVRWTIDYLLREGELTGKDLLELSFTLDDVKAAIEEDPSLDPDWGNYGEEELVASAAKGGEK